MPADLVADRFLALAGGAWLDVATGRRVEVTIGPLPRERDRDERPESAANTAAESSSGRTPCAGPALPRRLGDGWWLIDAGLLGADRVFEARDRAPDGADPAVFSSGHVEDEPCPVTGRALARAVEVWEHATSAVFRRTVVDVHDAARHALARYRFAREARVRGFVPVCPAALGRLEVRRAVRGRSVVLVSAGEEDGPAGGARRALALAVLAALDVRLAGCIVWETTAVGRSGAGAPPARGRWPRVSGAGTGRVAERGGGRSAFGNWSAGSLDGWAPHATVRSEPSASRSGAEVPRRLDGQPTGNLPAIGRLVAQADRAVVQGRPATALRWLRTAAGLARRRRFVRALLACAVREVEMLVARGQPGRAARAAKMALTEAADTLLQGLDAGADRSPASAGGPGASGVERAAGLAAATAAALARAEHESDRCEQARRALECVRMAAGEIGDSVLQAAATRRLAALLVEAGAAPTAEALLAVLDGGPGTTDPEALALGLRVSLALGRRRRAADLARQLSAIAPSLDLAEGLEARDALVRYFLDTGAVGAALQQVEALRPAARPGRAAAACARYRMLAREVFAAFGAGPVPRWLERAARTALPPAASPRLRRHLAGTGSRADTSAPVRRPPADSLGARSVEEGAAMHELLEILRICQEAEDESEALRGVCGLVRARLGASTAGIWAAGNSAAPLAASGTGRVWPSGVAERACTTGLVVGPEPAADGIEAAAPVRSAGLALGALACRWPPGTALDCPRTATLLETVAAATVHLVRAVTHRVHTPPIEGTDTLGLLGEGPAMTALRSAIQRAAAAPFHVLVEGESGSGKELVARALHLASPRRLHRFCALNCAALTDELLEAELFGHARGAFTGALAERPGIFEDAHGGTLFLDEVAELSPRGQAKVLRVLQDGEVRRVGENAPRRVDVRIVAATNRPLRDEVARGRFREDLRYRLDVLRLAVPPLRERREDIALLAGRFWADATRRLGSRATLDPDLVERLSRYDWPGNVRELQNVIAALAVHAPRRGRVGPGALPEALRVPGPAVPDSTLDAARRRFEIEFVRLALARAGGRRAEAARALGVTRQGLAKLMARLGLDAPRR